MNQTCCRKQIARQQDACQRQLIMSHYEKAWQAVLQRIQAAERAAGRTPGAVRLLAVSKTFSADAVRAVHALGQRAFGENYVQEGVAKRAQLADLPDVEWHFIGPLQSNKTAPAAAAFAWVESVDRLKIAERLSAQRPEGLPPLDVCIEVNVSGEASKGGVAPAEVPALAAAIAALPDSPCAASWAFRRRPRTSACSGGSFARCASASTRCACMGMRSTRCRWACRRTSRRRSPKGPRRCAWARPAFGPRGVGHGPRREPRCASRPRTAARRDPRAGHPFARLRSLPLTRRPDNAHEHLIRRRRQHGDRADRRPRREGRGCARLPRRRTHAGAAGAALRPVSRHRHLRRVDRGRDRWRRSRGAGGEAAADARRRAGARAVRRGRAGRDDDRRGHAHRRPVAVARRIPPHRPRDAQHAGARGRGHQRRVRRARGGRGRAASSPPGCSGRRDRCCGSSARTCSTR